MLWARTSWHLCDCKLVEVAPSCPINRSVINVIINSSQRNANFPYPGCTLGKGTGMESIPVAEGLAVAPKTFRNLSIPTLQQWKTKTELGDKCWKRSGSFSERREETVVPVHCNGSLSRTPGRVVLVSQTGGCSPDMQMSEPAVRETSDCSGVVLRQLPESLLLLLGLLPGDDQRVRVAHHHLQPQQHH